MNALGLIFFILLALVMIQVIYAALTFAPLFPTRKKDFARILRLSGLQPGEVFFDLGCGTGNVTLYMAKQGIHAVGIEYVYPLYLFCRLRGWVTRSKARFLYGDFRKKDLSAANAIFLFGLPETVTSHLFGTLISSCPQETKIISYVFPFQNIDPVLVDKPTAEDLSIFVYKKSRLHPVER